MDNIVAALANTDLFAGLKPRQLELIARVAKELVLAPETTLIEQDQSMTHLSIIAEGTASVAVNGAIVGEVGPGDVIGELSFIDQAPATATVTFAEGGKVWLIARTGFVPVWDKNRAEISTAMLFAVTKKLRETNSRIAG